MLGQSSDEDDTSIRVDEANTYTKLRMDWEEAAVGKIDFAHVIGKKNTKINTNTGS